MGLNFNGQGTITWGDMLAGTSGSSQNQQTAPPQVHTAPGQQQQQQKAPKPPKKELQGLNWLVANMSNEKITFNPGQV